MKRGTLKARAAGKAEVDYTRLISANSETKEMFSHAREMRKEAFLRRESDKCFAVLCDVRTDDDICWVLHDLSPPAGTFELNRACWR